MVCTSRNRTWLLVATVVAASLAQAPVAAREASDLVPPPFLSHLDGSVQLVRQAEPTSALLNGPVLDGDRYVATAGRFAIQWPDGVVAAFDHGASVDFREPRSLRVPAGHAIILVPEGADTTPVRLVTRTASLEFDQPGRYAVATDERTFDGETLVSVETGFVRLSSPAGELPVVSGQQALVRGSEPPRFTSLDDPLSPTFDRWARAAATDVVAPGSAGYLPAELHAFAGSMERHGSWHYDTSAGYVWYPRVAVDWQPFTAGTWVRAGNYGWFWVGTEVWTWPTHFYGGWGVDSRARWYWRPSRQWNAARVSWAAGSTGRSHAPGALSRGEPWRGRAASSAPLGRRLQPVVAPPAFPAYVPPTPPRQPQMAVSRHLGWNRTAPQADPRAANPRYDRPTPFVNPRWTSRPGLPDTVGLPQPGNRANEPTWYVVGPPPQRQPEPRATRPREDRGGRDNQRGGGSEHRGGRGGRR
ncbi:MAG: DUF6600 domain-containing protein [Vicinamibacterales bacterium]